MVGPIRGRGNSLAALIRAKQARRALLSEGVSVRARLTVESPHPFGLLQGIAKGSFDRRKERQWRDHL